MATARSQADINGRVQQLEQGYHSLFRQFTDFRNNHGQDHGHPDLYNRIQELEEAVQLVSDEVHEAVQCLEALGGPTWLKNGMNGMVKGEHAGGTDPRCSECMVQHQAEFVV